MDRDGSKAPALWIIAGPNGSGKSTLYGSRRDAIYGNTVLSDATRPFWIINPDLLAARIRSAERLSSLEANIKAVRRIESWLRASIDAHQSIGVETVLSTGKYRRLVRLAKKRGFEIRLVYVVLQSPELNVRRVEIRVRKGGHGVPIDKIKQRWHRSLRQLPWFLDQADWALLLDNSTDLRVIGRKAGKTVTLDPDVPVAIRRAVEKIRTGRRKWSSPSMGRRRRARARSASGSPRITGFAISTPVCSTAPWPRR
jgi:predicted ABC-type ATPase